MEFLFSPELLFSFITLAFLEIVLGIDNLVFIAIVVSNLPQRYRDRARYIGISLALIMRIIMLMTLSWVISMTDPLFTIFGLGFSFKNLLLIAGGVFLMAKSGIEIYADVKHIKKDGNPKKIIVKETFSAAVVQIVAVDFVFSFDSIITAVGMTNNIPIIVAAVFVAMLLMLFASDQISKMLATYPSLKIVALAFIFMIGTILLADGLHIEISKGYLYFSLFFAMAVEYLNILARKRQN
ncbi:MAG: rane protein [Rickettsiaceae bacterium]|jgi:predicted tellurium resistance membrane protein TerC|nr:rane protein [Rickettsiaceae bacterium]